MAKEVPNVLPLVDTLCAHLQDPICFRRTSGPRGASGMGAISNRDKWGQEKEQALREEDTERRFESG